MTIRIPKALLHEPLVTASLLDGLRAAALSLGVDLKALYDDVGITLVEGKHAEFFVPLNALARLVEISAAQQNDPIFGLRCAAAFPPGGSGVFGIIVINSKDLSSALKAAARYGKLVMSPLDVGWQEVETGAEFWWRYPSSFCESHVQYNSFLAAAFLARLKVIDGPDGLPERVDLEHKDPGCRSAYEDVFGRNVHFNEPVNRFVFPRRNLFKPQQSANPAVLRMARQLGDILLEANEDGGDFQTIVKDHIVELLGSNTPTLDTIASALGLSSRTLQRRLAASGTTFEKVLSETRHALANRLLQDTDLPLTEIAYMLGFSELSAFTRAAHRWFGASPSEARAQMRSVR